MGLIRLFGSKVVRFAPGVKRVIYNTRVGFIFEVAVAVEEVACHLGLAFSRTCGYSTKLLFWLTSRWKYLLENFIFITTNILSVGRSCCYAHANQVIIKVPFEPLNTVHYEKLN